MLAAQSSHPRPFVSSGLVEPLHSDPVFGWDAGHGPGTQPTLTSTAAA